MAGAYEEESPVFLQLPGSGQNIKKLSRCCYNGSRLLKHEVDMFAGTNMAEVRP